MKKLLLVGLTTLASQFYAQRTCGTPVMPQQYETWVQSLAPLTPVNPGKYGTSNIQSVFNIPVVVHIIHNNEAVNTTFATSGNNLNAAQVVDQINILNKDFNGTNADTSLIPTVFKPVLGKFQVNFCLAVVNPTGGIMPEPGIDRINRVAKGWSGAPYSQSYIDATIKPNSIWNPNFYLNIWVCDLGSGLLGYATFPAAGTSGLSGLTGSGSSTTDGVVILNSAFGSIGTGAFGAYNKGRTATHEIGHWIGLRHIWGDGTCLTDYCNDTPPAQNANYGCFTHPYKLGVCTGNTTGEMTMNYMDYSDDACLYMFTQDQKYRAQLILTNSPMRTALISSTVCNLPTIGNDIGITFVSKPTYSQTLNCTNTITPVVSITNYGSTTLTSAVFVYNVDGVNTQTLNWTGSVSPNSTFTVGLNQISNLSLGTHVFSVNVSSPNGGADNNLSNNNNQQTFSITGNLSISVTPGITCPGVPVTLYSGGATTYSWNTGITTSSITVSPSATTVYTVTGTTGACSTPKTVTVTVQTPPAVVLNKTSVCEGAPTVLTASGASSYTWSTGPTGTSITVTLTSSASYTVTGASSAGCTSTSVFNVSVNPLPTATTLATFVSCASCSDASISVTASGGTGPYTYSWTPVNVNTPTVGNAATGCYTVTISDAFGCFSVDSVCVSFDTGIFDRTLTDPAAMLMPNPTSGEFEIGFATSGNKKIEIFDTMGRLLKTTESVALSVSININTYSDGIYYAKITSEKRLTVLKIIKQQ
jgi:hypothetical protein